MRQGGTRADAHRYVRVLLKTWDPVGEGSQAQDLYDPLIEPVLELLRSNAPADEMTAHLIAERAGMGMGSMPNGLNSDRWLASELLRWWMERDSSS